MNGSNKQQEAKRQAPKSKGWTKGVFVTVMTCAADAIRITDSGPSSPSTQIAGAIYTSWTTKSNQEKKAIHKVWNLFALAYVKHRKYVGTKIGLKNSQNQKAVRMQILEGVLH